MKNVNRSMSAFDWLLLIVLSILWGGSFFFVGVAVKALPPFTLVLLRVGLAAIALNIILRVMGQKMPRDRQIWRDFVFLGLINNVIPFSLIVWGQTHIAGGLASILNATTPIFTLVVAHFLTSDEKLSGGRMAGIAIGFTGVAVIIGIESLGNLGANILAQLAVVGAALSYAFAGVFGRRFARLGVAPMVAATGQLTMSTILLTPIALAVEKSWALAMPALPVWVAVFALALASTAIAYIIYFRLLATAGATNLLLVTFLIPVSAIFLGALFLNEQLVLKDFSGMGLIGLGLVAIDGRLAAFFQRWICEKQAVKQPF
ncbi:MAG: EamA family transporter [Deltaproteobacteria bacterium]|nr:EamA family transporter [Deltaproteobacteria bacterium]